MILSNPIPTAATVAATVPPEAATLQSARAHVEFGAPARRRAGKHHRAMKGVGVLICFLAFLAEAICVSAKGDLGETGMAVPDTAEENEEIGVSGGATNQHWHLVWSNEFNHQGLPDKTKWNYEEGFVRNHESQYYTRGRKENARVENGCLILECRKEHLQPAKGKTAEYTSASLTSKTNWLYGRFEMRAKLPQGQGVWPAFWTLGTSRVGWPACGEIDIMEFVGKQPGVIHGTVHYAMRGTHQKEESELKTTNALDEFHTYAVEWSPKKIDFFMDQKKYHTFNLDQAGTGADNPFRKPHRLLLNLALGGSWGGPVDDAILPQQYVIDYIRVYQNNPKPPQ